MIYNNEKIRKYLDEAQEYADRKSGCKKVAVGSLLRIHSAYKTEIFGANETLPVSCREHGCRRIELYGEDSKKHRLPSDCRATHSEIVALTSAAMFGMSTKGADLFVTRYPCEACARAIVTAGVKRVYYGREQEISEETKKIFEAGNVTVKWVKEWTYEDVVEK